MDTEQAKLCHRVGFGTVDISIMIEGQDGLTWRSWKALVRAVESLGFAGLFRSDHFTNAGPPDKDSLELWVSLTYLADHTERIRFGPLVCPLTFRHPVIIARQASALDDLSGGRMVLGMGAGWQEREHHLFGFSLPTAKVRLDRLEEGIQIARMLLQSDQPVEFKGRFYELNGATLLPQPERQGRLPLLVGGSGLRRTPEIAARFASYWNGIYLTPDQFAERSRNLDGFAQSSGRDPSEIKRTMMTGIYFGKDSSGLSKKLDSLRRVQHFADKNEDELLAILRSRGAIAGTPDAVSAQLEALEAAGCEEVMLQWLELDDLEGLKDLADLSL